MPGTKAGKFCTGGGTAGNLREDEDEERERGGKRRGKGGEEEGER